MIILTGSLAYDFILNFNGNFTDHILPDKIHTINLSFLAEKLSKEKGGIAGNIGYNLALLGIKPLILGSLGEKDGKEYLEHLKKWGIETKYIKLVKDEFTASYIVVTDLLNNQIGAFYPGAMKEDKKRSLKETIFSCHSEPAAGEAKNPHRKSGNTRDPSALPTKSGFAQDDIVVISPGEPKAMEKFIRECQALNLPNLFDPGKQLPYLNDEVLKLGISKCQILIANDYEIALIEKRIRFNKKKFLYTECHPELVSGTFLVTVQNSGHDILRTTPTWSGEVRSSLPTESGSNNKDFVSKTERLPFLSQGMPKQVRHDNQGKRILITTFGEKGSIIETKNKSFKIKAAKPKKVVDPVGAGDAYLGGFLAGHLRGFNLKTCGQMGSVCAVYTVEKYGTQTHKFTKKEFVLRYKNNYGEEISL